MYGIKPKVSYNVAQSFVAIDRAIVKKEGNNSEKEVRWCIVWDLMNQLVFIKRLGRSKFAQSLVEIDIVIVKIDWIDWYIKLLS